MNGTRNGTRERTEMSIEQLVDFRDYLRGLPSK